MFMSLLEHYPIALLVKTGMVPTIYGLVVG